MAVPMTPFHPNQNVRMARRRPSQTDTLEVASEKRRSPHMKEAGLVFSFRQAQAEQNT